MLDHKSPDAGALRQPRVLVVEDDPNLREVLARIFAAQGFEAVTAGTLADGMRALESNPTHLVLDLGLPDGNGLSMLQHIRSRGLPVKVAVLTGIGKLESLSKVVALGPEKVFLKPFGIDEVRKWLAAEAARDDSMARIRSAILSQRVRRRFGGVIENEVRGAVELSKKDIQEITGQADVRLGEYRRGEQRRADRLPLSRRAKLSRLRDGDAPAPPVSVIVREISVSGVGLLHAEPMRVGEQFLLDLPRGKAGKGGGWVPVRCLVRRCERGGSGGSLYTIGATFIALRDAEAILIEHFLNADLG